MHDNISVVMHLKKAYHMETFRRNTPNGWADFNRLPCQMTEKTQNAFIARFPIVYQLFILFEGNIVWNLIVHVAKYVPNICS